MRIFSLVLLFFICAFGAVLSPDEAFRADANASVSEISLTFSVADEIYIYENELKIFIDERDVTGLLNMPASKKYKQYKIFDGNFSVAISFGLVLGNAKNADDFHVVAKFLGCTKGGFCYEPQARAFGLSRVQGEYSVHKISQNNLQNLAHNFTQNSANFTASKNSEQSKILEIFANQNFIMVLTLFFGYGLLLSLTPCIYPLIPILSSIIVAKTAIKPSVKISLLVSLIYVLGMATSYAILGAFVAIFGENLQGLLQTKAAIIITAIIFALLALSMFGFYDIQLPARMRNFLHTKSDARRGFAGVYVMGVISALIVSPCISAPLAGALVYIANTGEVTLGAAALFALGLGSGALLLVIGLGGALPRPGAWMDAVPKIFGFLLLFVAVWTLRTVIGENFALLLYAILGALLAGFLGLFDGISNGLKRALALVIAIYSALLLIGFASGASDFAKPLGAFANSARSQVGEISRSPNFTYVKNLRDLNERIKSSQKPVIVDFWAVWCKNCEESEEAFATLGAQGKLENFTLLKVDLSENSNENREIKNAFEIMGPPSVLFFLHGAEIDNFRQIGAVHSAKLAEILLQIQ